MPIVFVQEISTGGVGVGSVRASIDLKRMTARGRCWAWFDMVAEDAIKFVVICNEAKIRLGEGASAIEVICEVARRTELFPQPVIGWRTRKGAEPEVEEAAAAIMRILTAEGQGVQVSMGVVCNRARRYKPSMMRVAAANIVKAKRAQFHVDTHPVNGKVITKLSLL